MAFQSRGEKALKSAVLRYGLSVLSVAISLTVTLLLQDYTFRTPLFFPAILLSTWFLGTGPGLLAVVLSTLSINFFILEPKFAFAFGYHDAVHLTVFLFSALLLSSWSETRRRAELGLRHARDELDTRVRERTADLSQRNEQFSLIRLVALFGRLTRKPSGSRSLASRPSASLVTQSSAG
jgi:K+-sensing histidine kinase KdpD